VDRRFSKNKTDFSAVFFAAVNSRGRAWFFAAATLERGRKIPPERRGLAASERSGALAPDAVKWMHGRRANVIGAGFPRARPSHAFASQPLFPLFLVIPMTPGAPDNASSAQLGESGASAAPAPNASSSPKNRSFDGLPADIRKQLFTAKLHGAVHADNPDLIFPFLDAGADPLLPMGDMGVSAVDLAADTGSAACLALLLERADLRAQSACWDQEAVESGVKHPKISRNAMRMTPLMLAAKSGHAECVALLLPHSRLNDRMSKSSTTFPCATAFMLAAWFQRPECVATLARASTPEQINATDNHGRTALMMAAKEGDAKEVGTLRALLAHGANPWLADKDGKTAFDLAAARNRFTHVAFLIAETAKDPANAPFLARVLEGALALNSAFQDWSMIESFLPAVGAELQPILAAHKAIWPFMPKLAAAQEAWELSQTLAQADLDAPAESTGPASARRPARAL